MDTGSTGVQGLVPASVMARFLESYAECRAQFASEKSWHEIWSNHWSHFILWNPMPPQQKPLMKVFAEKLSLEWWDGEPFRLDGAMVPRTWDSVGNYRLPILVAVEHENDYRTFKQEIVKLAHIVCPLKLGVTYLLVGPKGRDQERETSLLAEIHATVSRTLSQRKTYVSEDPNTRYMFILGSEVRTEEFAWHYLSVSAGEDPNDARWMSA